MINAALPEFQRHPCRVFANAVELPLQWKWEGWRVKEWRVTNPTSVILTSVIGS